MKTLKLPLPINTCAVASLFVLLGCVNRGQQAPSDAQTGVGGHNVMDAAGEGGAQVITDGGVDAVDNCDIDGGSIDAGPPSSCTALFNFESPAGCGLYGAALGSTPSDPAATAGFTRLYHTPVAFCGRGGMAVDVDFDASTRTGGEIIIPVSADGTARFSGKTLTFSVMGSADGGAMRFYAFLVAGGQFQQVLVTPITTSWQTLSVSLPVPDASADDVMSISLEAFGRGTTYKGTIYIDEIDVRNTVPDGGANDGAAPDLGPSDARSDADGAAGDVRDAPAGA